MASASDLSTVRNSLYKALSQSVTVAGKEYFLFSMSTTEKYLVKCHMTVNGSEAISASLSDSEGLRSVSADSGSASIGVSFYLANGGWYAIFTSAPDSLTVRKELIYGVASNLATASSSDKLTENELALSYDGLGKSTAIKGTIVGTLSGNAATASSLSVSRKINISGAGLNASADFDGSSDITETLSGTVPVANGGTGLATLTSSSVLIGNGSSSVSMGPAIASSNAALTIVERDALGNFSAGTISAAFSGNLTGNVLGTATSATNAFLLSVSSRPTESGAYLVGMSSSSSAYSQAYVDSSVYFDSTGIHIGNDVLVKATEVSNAFNNIGLAFITSTTDHAKVAYIEDKPADVGGVYALNKSYAITPTLGIGSISISSNTGVGLYAAPSTMSGTSTITTLNLDGTLSVSHGGTGNATLISSSVLVGNGTGAIASGPSIAETATPLTIVKRDANGTISASSISATNAVITNISGKVTGSLVGNADTAAKLASAKKINISGALTGSSSFDGSSDANIALSGTVPVANGGTGLSALTKDYALIGNGGDAVAFKQVASTNALSAIVARDANGDFTAGYITAVGGFYGNLYGNASTAYKFTDVKTISISGMGINPTLINYGVDSSSDITLTGTVPVANGGTGSTMLTASSVLIGNGTGAIVSGPSIAEAATPSTIVERDANGSIFVNAISASGSISAGSVTVSATVTAHSLSSSGAYINGDITVTGSLFIEGATTTVSKTTVNLEDYVITLGAGNTSSLQSMAGIRVPKYDGTNDGFFGYDSDGTAYIGDIAAGTADGDIKISTATSLQPLATRLSKAEMDASAGQIIVWSSTSNAFVPSGYKAYDASSSSTPSTTVLRDTNGSSWFGAVNANNVIASQVVQADTLSAGTAIYLKGTSVNNYSISISNGVLTITTL